MNAHELAEIVDKWAYSESAEYLTDAANMLRQQADRIAELEKQTFFIADPEKQGEPVAWMDEHENVIFEKNWAYPIPLYTSLVFCKAPQTKPLSDEEIKEVWLKRPANTAEDVVRFARAIEERHGIK